MHLYLASNYFLSLFFTCELLSSFLTGMIGQNRHLAVCSFQHLLRLLSSFLSGAVISTVTSSCLHGFLPGPAIIQRHASGVRLIGHCKLPLGVDVSVWLFVLLCQPCDELAREETKKRYCISTSF